MGIEVEGFCIHWNSDDHPRLEECSVEKRSSTTFHRHYPDVRGFEVYTLNTDFFYSRLYGLQELRRQLVKLGDECRQTLERVHLDCWKCDEDIRQEVYRGYGKDIKE